MSHCCGCFNIAGLLSDDTKSFIVKCNYKLRTELQNGNSYEIPRTGWYAIYLSARGGDATKAISLDYATGVRTAYLQKGTIIPYSLGETATLTIPNTETLTLHSSSVPNYDRNSSTNKASSVIFTYLGRDWSTATTKGYYPNGFPHSPTYIANNLGIKLQDYNVMIPNPADVQWNHTGEWKAYQWYTIDLDFPVDGEYGFAAFGDDVGNMTLDGVPIIWYSSIDPNNFIGNRANDFKNGENGGWVKKYVTKGKHRIVIFNISNYCCEVWTTYAITKPDGSIFATPSTHVPKYIGQPVDCFEKVVIPYYVATNSNDNTNVN